MDKLLYLLKLARPSEIDDQTKEILEEILKNCGTCQQFAPTPVRVKVALPTEEGDLALGVTLSMDLMWIDEKFVLYIVDTATQFKAESFLDSHGETYGQSVDGMW